MTTLIELQARVADLDQQIAEWYERIAKIKPERAALAYHAIDYLHGERAALARKVSNWQEVAKSATRRKANRVARRWGVTWEDDSYRENGYYNHLHYFPKPDFIEGADPLGDGHYA